MWMYIRLQTKLFSGASEIIFRVNPSWSKKKKIIFGSAGMVNQLKLHKPIRNLLTS